MNKKNTYSTNYYNTFIEIAEDTMVSCSTIPSSNKDKKTIAEMQYELIVNNPYKFTSDEILFQLFADRNDLSEAQYEQARQQFFSKGQACLRSSPLPKKYGFGIHFNDEGKVAIYGMETKEYKKFIADHKVKKVKALRTSKK